jgi:hypothetical protein
VYLSRTLCIPSLTPTRLVTVGTSGGGRRCGAVRGAAARGPDREVPAAEQHRPGGLRQRQDPPQRQLQVGALLGV